MIKAKDAQGRELEFSVYGTDPDDIQVNEIYYTNPADPEVVEDAVINYVEREYAAEIYEAWMEDQIGRAEAYYEGDR